MFFPVPCRRRRKPSSRRRRTGPRRVRQGRALPRSPSPPSRTGDRRTREEGARQRPHRRHRRRIPPRLLAPSTSLPASRASATSRPRPGPFTSKVVSPKAETVVIEDRLSFPADHPFLEAFDRLKKIAGDAAVKYTIPSPSMLHLICCVRATDYEPIAAFKDNEGFFSTTSHKPGPTPCWRSTSAAAAPAARRHELGRILLR